MASQGLNNSQNAVPDANSGAEVFSGGFDAERQWGEGTNWWNPHKWFGHDAPPSSPILSMADQDWKYFQQNILPVQQGLFRQAMSPQTFQRNEAQAKADVDSQYAGLPTAFKRGLAGMGIAPTAAQTAAFQKQSNVNRGLAEAGAMNQARQTTAAQSRAILGA